MVAQISVIAWDVMYGPNPEIKTVLLIGAIGGGAVGAAGILHNTRLTMWRVEEGNRCPFAYESVHEMQI